MPNYDLRSDSVSADPAGRRFRSGASYDEPLAESDFFICVPSLGSLVPGWLLVIPKRSVLNLARLNSAERKEFGHFTTQMKLSVEQEFGESVMFEHGANEQHSIIGCGVDQAHLHIVPINSSIFGTALRRHNINWSEERFYWPFDKADIGSQYLWYSDGVTSKTAIPVLRQSQFFRRVIAEMVGLPSQWDYREHPFLENIERTRKVILARQSESLKRAG